MQLVYNQYFVITLAMLLSKYLFYLFRNTSFISYYSLNNGNSNALLIAKKTSQLVLSSACLKDKWLHLVELEFLLILVTSSIHSKDHGVVQNGLLN